LEISNEFLKNAVSAYNSMELPFQLAMCGWVIGPLPNRAYFDTRIPGWDEIFT
jgi:hypothetical protein